MRTHLSRPADAVSELFLRPSFDDGVGPATHPAPPAERQSAFSDRPSPTFSRRSVIATLAAAFAPAAGTAAALPVVIKTAAAAGLEEARAIAGRLWPAVPADLVVGFNRVDRYFYTDCYAREIDFEGNEVWPEPYLEEGKLFGYPLRLIMHSDGLKQFLAAVDDEPDSFDDGLADDLAGRHQAATQYEAACAHSIGTSGIVDAKQEAQYRAQDLHSIMFDIRKHVPRTIGGVLIMARAIVAFEEAQKESYSGRQRGGGMVLGRELADAVLRVSSQATEGLADA
jgi:hypothetical protein